MVLAVVGHPVEAGPVELVAEKLGTVLEGPGAPPLLLDGFGFGGNDRVGPLALVAGRCPGLGVFAGAQEGYSENQRN